MSQDVQDVVGLAVAGPVATLTLNRPGSYNALNPDLARGLRVRAETVETCEDIRMLVIRGAGRGFCGGGDIQAALIGFRGGAGFVAQPGLR